MADLNFARLSGETLTLPQSAVTEHQPPVRVLRAIATVVLDEGLRLGLLTILLIAAGLSAAAPGAMAQSPDPKDAEGEVAPAGTPQFFETTNVVARPVSSSAGSVSVVEVAEVEQTAARSLSEALRSVAGLGLLSSGGRAGTTQAYIRGGDPNFGLVLLDGIPLNDPTDLQGGAVNLEELPALLLERVEVVRGPLTSFYGPASLAGVVQLFTARGGPGPTRLSLGAEAGNAELRHAFGRVMGPTSRGGYSGGASWDQERGRVGNDRFRALDLWGTWDHDLGGDKDLAVTSRVSSGAADDYPDGSGGPVYGTGELRHTERLDLALVTRLEWGDPGERRHRVFVAVSRRALDRTSPEVPPLVPASIEETAYTRLRGAWEVPLVRKKRTALDAGLSGEAEWADNVSVLHLPPGLGGDIAGDYEESRATGGVFLGLRHGPGPLLLEASLRLDAATGDSLQVNPQVGVVWRLDASGATRLRATGGRASKLPSFFGLSSPPALGGNPDLRPERTLGGEVGAERSFGSDRLALGAAFFVQEYKDLVDFDFDLFQTVNRRRVRAKGTELTLRSRLTATLSLNLEATWLQAEAGSDQPLLHRPRWQGGGRLRFEPGTRLSLVLEGRASSSSLDRQIPTPDLDRVSGYAVWGLAASFRVSDRWTIRTRLDNLTDRVYETYIGFPGPKRGFWLGLSWQRT
jgi:vitamin B12 transporter